MSSVKIRSLKYALELAKAEALKLQNVEKDLFSIMGKHIPGVFPFIGFIFKKLHFPNRARSTINA